MTASQRVQLLIELGYDGRRFYGVTPQPGLPTVADALTARVEGLRGREYLDSLDGRVRKTENGARRDATNPHSPTVALEPARDASNARP